MDPHSIVCGLAQGVSLCTGSILWALLPVRTPPISKPLHLMHYGAISYRIIVHISLKYLWRSFIKRDEKSMISAINHTSAQFRGLPHFISRTGTTAGHGSDRHSLSGVSSTLQGDGFWYLFVSMFCFSQICLLINILSLLNMVVSIGNGCRI